MLAMGFSATSMLIKLNAVKKNLQDTQNTVWITVPVVIILGTLIKHEALLWNTKYFFYLEFILSIYKYNNEINTYKITTFNWFFYCFNKRLYSTQWCTKRGFLINAKIFAILPKSIRLRTNETRRIPSQITLIKKPGMVWSTLRHCGPRIHQLKSW